MMPIYRMITTVRPARVALILVFFSAFPVSPAFPSNFSINPTSLELAGSVRSGAFSVVNSGSEKLNCQVDVKEWSQDADGKDVYTDTKDVIFFPKIMTVEPNEQRAIRVGIKIPAGLKEKAYRLFVEEIPSQQTPAREKKNGAIRAGLTIAFRYAMPIFVKPARQQETANMEKVDMANGVATVVVGNTGNVHVKLLSVAFTGKAADGTVLFSQDIAGWYILQGLSRSYETTVPKQVCGDLATIDVRAQAENLAIDGTLHVQRNMCAH